MYISDKNPNKQDSSAPSVPKRKGTIKILITIMRILAAIVIALVIFMVYVWYQLGGGHANKAAAAMSPINVQLSELGANKICENGDNGYSIDNRQPWHTEYYTINDTGNLANQLDAIATKAGYPLGVDTQHSNIERESPNHVIYGGNTNNDYFSSTKYLDSSRFDVEIVRHGIIALNCNDENIPYGQERTPMPGEAIIYLSITFPVRK